MPSRRHRLLGSLSALLAVSLLLPSCSFFDRDPSETRTVEAGGGEVEFDDGTVKITVPAESAPEDLEITYTPDADTRGLEENGGVDLIVDPFEVTPPRSDLMGTTVSITPDDKVLEEALAENGSADQIVVVLWNDWIGAWFPLLTEYDEAAGTFSAQPTHYSPVGLASYGRLAQDSAMAVAAEAQKAVAGFTSDASEAISSSIAGLFPELKPIECDDSAPGWSSTSEVAQVDTCIVRDDKGLWLRVGTDELVPWLVQVPEGRRHVGTNDYDEWDDLFGILSHMMAAGIGDADVPGRGRGQILLQGEHDDLGASGGLEVQADLTTMGIAVAWNAVSWLPVVKNDQYSRGLRDALRKAVTEAREDRDPWELVDEAVEHMPSDLPEIAQQVQAVGDYVSCVLKEVDTLRSSVEGQVSEDIFQDVVRLAKTCANDLAEATKEVVEKVTESKVDELWSTVGAILTSGPDTLVALGAVFNSSTSITFSRTDITFRHDLAGAAAWDTLAAEADVCRDVSGDGLRTTFQDLIPLDVEGDGVQEVAATFLCDFDSYESSQVSSVVVFRAVEDGSFQVMGRPLTGAGQYFYAEPAVSGGGGEVNVEGFVSVDSDLVYRGRVTWHWDGVAWSAVDTDLAQTANPILHQGFSDGTTYAILRGVDAQDVYLDEARVVDNSQAWADCMRSGASVCPDTIGVDSGADEVRAVRISPTAALSILEDAESQSFTPAEKERVLIERLGVLFEVRSVGGDVVELHEVGW